MDEREQRAEEEEEKLRINRAVFRDWLVLGLLCGSFAGLILLAFTLKFVLTPTTKPSDIPMYIFCAFYLVICLAPFGFSERKEEKLPQKEGGGR